MAHPDHVPTRAKLRSDVFQRLLASRHFVHAESLRRILRYLFDRAQQNPEATVREQEIATHALGRAGDFDPKIDAVVRVAIASVREKLRSYFDVEGLDEPLRLTVPRGQYRLCFEPAPDPDARAKPASAGRARFWHPYLGPEQSNALVFTDVLFFRDADGNYVRNIYVNDRATGADELRRRLILDEDREFTPSYHFVSAGEMNCLLSIAQTFYELGAKLQFQNSRFLSWSDVRRSNLILLGSARINSFVKSLQGNLPLVTTSDAIEEREPKSGGPSRWQGHRYHDGDLERVLEYALVTRRSGPVSGSAVTIISANHGRAIEGAGKFLTDEHHLRGLQEVFGRDEMAQDFQLLLKVEMLDYDEEVVDVSYVTHRVLGTTHPLAER